MMDGKALLPSYVQSLKKGCGQGFSSVVRGMRGKPEVLSSIPGTPLTKKKASFGMGFSNT